MKVPYQGRQVEGKPVDFLTRKEDFNEYQLADGKILMTCPPKSSPVLMLDWRHNKGVGNAKEGLYTRANHQQASAS